MAGGSGGGGGGGRRDELGPLADQYLDRDITVLFQSSNLIAIACPGSTYGPVSYEVNSGRAIHDFSGPDSCEVNSGRAIHDFSGPVSYEVNSGRAIHDFSGPVLAAVTALSAMKLTLGERYTTSVTLSWQQLRPCQQ